MSKAQLDFDRIECFSTNEVWAALEKVSNFLQFNQESTGPVKLKNMALQYLFKAKIKDTSAFEAIISDSLVKGYFLQKKILSDTTSKIETASGLPITEHYTDLCNSVADAAEINRIRPILLAALEEQASYNCRINQVSTLGAAMPPAIVCSDSTSGGGSGGAVVTPEEGSVHAIGETDTNTQQDE